MINHSIEIHRPAEQVFAYLDQVDRHNEWQSQLVSTTVETDGPIRVGTRVVERRNVPGGTRDFPYEITEHDPPRKISFRGTAGLIRPAGTYTRALRVEDPQPFRREVLAVTRPDRTPRTQTVIAAMREEAARLIDSR